MKKASFLMIIIWSVIGALILAVMIGGIFTRYTGMNLVFSGFGTSGTSLVVDETLATEDLEGLNEISIELASDECHVYLTDDSVINVRHHVQNVNKDSYVKVGKTGGRLTISTKTFNSFNISIFDWGRRRSVIDVYLPKSYSNALSVNLSSGSIDFGGDLDVSGFNVKLSSGSVSSNYSVKAGTADIGVSSGVVKLRGGLSAEDYRIEVTSGSVSIDENLTGSGRLKTTSGTIQLNGVSITNSLNAEVTSGTISIRLAGDPSLNFTGHKSSGTIRTYFPVYTNGNSTTATVGEGSYKNLDVRVTSGTIKITQ